MNAVNAGEAIPITRPGLVQNEVAALYHRRGQVTGNAFSAGLQRLGQHDHGVDARHLGKHRDRLRARRGHVAVGAAAFERAGKAYRLDRRMLDQRLTDAAAKIILNTPAGISVASAARMIASATRSAVAMCPLWARTPPGSRRPARQRCRRQPWKMPGEVAGAEHRHRAEADTVLAQVRARQRLALWQGLVDTCAVEVTTAQHGGEQAHLAAGAPAFAFDACGRQGGFAADQFDEVIAQGVQLIGHRIQELRTPCGAQGAIGWVLQPQAWAAAFLFQNLSYLLR